MTDHYEWTHVRLSRVKRTPNNSTTTEHAIDVAYQYADTHGMPRKVLLPAVGDILIANEYWQHMRDDGWQTCQSCHAVVYPFVACCPSCLLDSDRFTKLHANKPKSGTIGKVGTLVLLSTLQVCIDRAGRSEVMVQLRKPDDAAMLGLAKPAFGEVKTSPFITPPVIQLDEPRILLPFGSTHRLTCCQDDEFLTQFYSDWLRLWPEYLNPATHISPYYLTNACGKRNRINISDTKTSVGADRTDDIQKSFFKATDMKSRCKEAAYSLVLSNLPPMRHTDTYNAEHWFSEHGFNGVITLGGSCGIRDPELAEFATFDWIERPRALAEAA